MQGFASAVALDVTKTNFAVWYCIYGTNTGTPNYNSYLFLYTNNSAGTGVGAYQSQYQGSFSIIATQMNMVELKYSAPLSVITNCRSATAAFELTWGAGTNIWVVPNSSFITNSQ